MTRFTSELAKRIRRYSSTERRLACAYEFFQNCTKGSRIKRLSMMQIKQCMNGIGQIIPLLDGEERDDMLLTYEKLMMEKSERKAKARKSFFRKMFGFVLKWKA